MPRWPRTEVEPYKRTGLCCGTRCRKSKRRSMLDQVLFLVSPSRYRCGECFRRECGHAP